MRIMLIGKKQQKGNQATRALLILLNDLSIVVIVITIEHVARVLTSLSYIG